MKSVLAWATLLPILPALPAFATDWQIVSVNNTPAQMQPNIEFAQDGGFAGTTGCNGFSGNGQMEDARWTVSEPVATTRKACPTPEMQDQEAAILGLLDGVVDLMFDVTADRLIMSGNGTTVTMVRQGDKGADLTGVVVTPPKPSLDDARYLDVFGLTGKLNIRANPSTSAPVVDKVLAGTLLVNEGCAPQEGRDWCHVMMLGATEKLGWAAAEFLEPATAAFRVLHNTFDEIGLLDCTPQDFDSPIKCEYGIARDPNKTAVQVIYNPDGSAHTLFYMDGDLAYVRDNVEGAPLSFTAFRNEGRFQIQIGQDMYEFDWSRMVLD